MKLNRYLQYSVLALAVVATSCDDNTFNDYGQDTSGENAGLITLQGEIEQVSVSRAADSGFADGDVIGVYVVDYEGGNPGALALSGNRADNVRHTFDEAGHKWTSAYDIYWKDKSTPIDVYGYYPFMTVDNIHSQTFEIAKDQSQAAADGALGGYEASDFLWGKATKVPPTDRTINLPMRHSMASVRVSLVEGDGFGQGEWAGFDRSLLVVNTVRATTIDLATGVVTPVGDPAATGTIPYRNGDQYRAIVAPQTVAADVDLLSITVNGVSYGFRKDTPTEYVAGKMLNLSIRVDNKGSDGKYTFTLIGESITPWENDEVSHDATAREYVVVNVDQPGTLAECITAAGKDLTQIANLKLTGNINDDDFFVMREHMDKLKALNLKDVKLINDEIPDGAMTHKKTLISLVLPDKLKVIGRAAFEECDNLAGSLIIPEGVEEIRNAAFYGCHSLTGRLSLPSTLKRIGNADTQGAGAFCYCNFACELVIPHGVVEIGSHTFSMCEYLYGELRLPAGLEKLGNSAFFNCQNLSGSLTIPSKIKVIPSACFSSCKLGGVLTLHDGITRIENEAFSYNDFKGELVLPKDVEVISRQAFRSNAFTNIKFPKGLLQIGDEAFDGNCWLRGTLEFPDNLLSIGKQAFSSCFQLEGLVLPEGLETIMPNAFEACSGLGSIVCKSNMPPYVMTGAFDGVPKDNFTLEVPESAVPQYQTATGWCEFKRIAAHHELVCRPAMASALNSETTRPLVLNAEGEWEVTSMPDWCSLSQTSGNEKTELTLTIQQKPNTGEMREGDIVFSLKGKDYTHSCHVSQYDYDYAEDEIVNLQTATRGNRGGINLVFLGDGFDAKTIHDGNYMSVMMAQVENFFDIEPYRTYRDYFNVNTAIAVSPESGIGTINTLCDVKFETTYTGGVGLQCNSDAVWDYALRIPSVTRDNIDQTLVVMVPNSSEYGGTCQMWESGAAIAICPLNSNPYPLDTRGVLQHEAGGHGFGKLGDEYIYWNEFVDLTTTQEIKAAKSRGWYDNLSLTGKMHEVTWSHLIFNDKYSRLVDIWEGGCRFARGVYRSEHNSCMNNNIPYYSTISRESIVKRIKAYAGETYSFDDFVANDKIEVEVTSRSRSAVDIYNGPTANAVSTSPVIMRGSPIANKGRQRVVNFHNHKH